MIVAFSVQPTGEPSGPALARHLGEGADGASVHDAVAAAVRVVRDSGLPTRTSSMFTEIEGEWDDVMDVVRRATEEAGRYGSRVSLVLKADIRPGHEGELDGKIHRMEQALGELDG
ncbi:thiamine-binding protein [Brachybacterium alimentarium]|uniref:thiamine-binding protein n=1 Tax=Brachybacterium alimentarium TaxID=47845 RepID=UPI000DF2C652|nr:thiamine-binding protein [Brachybacterium alimentarium]RCS63917.1 thiamine-binding protein [Brachybacterium alimentarium]